MKRKQSLISLLTLFLMLFSIIPTYRFASANTVPIDNSFVLKAVGQCGYINLEWKPVEGAAHYYIYRGIGEGNQHSMPLTDFPIKETFYQDGSDIKEGVKYCYYVRAVGLDKKEFLQSIEACAIPSCSSSNPCKEPPVKDNCKLSLKYQTGNKLYWVNNAQKGPMEAAPENRWSRLFLVVRYVTSEVNAQITWDGTNRIVTILTASGNKLEFQIGNNKYKLNGVEQPVDPNNSEVAPYIKEGRTMLPLRRTGEALDAEDIIWDATTTTAELVFKDPECACEQNCPYPEYAYSSKRFDLASGCDMRYIVNDPNRTAAHELAHVVQQGMKSIPLKQAETTLQASVRPWMPSMYEGGACWVYNMEANTGTWQAPTKEQKSIYRHKFCVDACTEVTLTLYAFGNVEIYLDGISPAQKVAQAVGQAPNQVSITFTIPSGGTHYLYFIHHIVPNKPIGLLYGATFKPCEEKPPLDLKKEQQCDGVYLFCAEVIEPCTANKVKVKLSSGNIVTVDVSALTSSTNPCPVMLPGSSWYIGGKVVANELKASYLHKNESSCEKEELQKLRCLCIEIIKIDRETYTIYAIINGVEMKFSYFAHQNQWMWSNLNINQLKEKHCYKIWVVSKEAYIPPKVFYFEEVKCPCGDGVECKWSSQGRIVSTRWDESDRWWVVNFLTCTNETMILYTAVDLLDISQTYPISQATKLCVRFCLDYEGKKIVKWEVMPEPCCPEQGEKKICGCIVRMTLDPDGNGNYHVYIKQNCALTDPAYDLVLFVPATLLDTNMGFDVKSYFHMFPDPDRYEKNTVCVEMKFNSSMQVVEWKAFPDRQPCCEEKPDCQWSQNGYLVSIVEKVNADGTKYWVVTAKDCDGNVKDFILNTDPAMFFAHNSPNFPLAQVGDRCLKLCLRQVPTPTHVAYEIIAWELVDGECCPQTKKLCGCIIRMTLDPDANGNYKIYIKKNCQAAQPGEPAFDIALDIPSTLLDSNLGLTALAYFNMMPGTAPKYNVCVDLLFNSSNQVTQWWAHPDRQPCCDEKPECKWTINGHLVTIDEKVNADGTPYWLVIFKDCDGNVINFTLHTNPNVFFANNNPNFPLSKVGDQCLKFCIRQIPSNTHVAYEIIAWELVDGECCPQTNRGRILVKMPKECLDGTLLTIYNQNGAEVWSGKANSDGVFDTGCKLPCPGIYKVVPKNENCTFYPEAREVIMTKENCCDYTHVVDFKCECESNIKKGRIQVKMPDNCIKNTTVTIYDQQGNRVWRGAVNPQTGLFDTECTLPCPGIYKVVPSNDKCKFFPESQEVKMTENMCCDRTNIVEFKCECESEVKKARIQVLVPKNCLEGTIVYIYDQTGKEVWSGRYNPNLNLFDTACTLACPGIYKIVPKNNKCKFSPESQEVNINERLCCDYINKVEFKCDCEQAKGRIQVKVAKECLEGTIVTVYDASGREVWKGRHNPDLGYFDTGCSLPCPGTYKVVPKNEKCKFYPESATVTMSERMCCDYINVVDFKCECEAEKGRILISVPRNCINGTTMKIYEGELMPGKRPVMTLQANDQGVFDSDCTLKCNTVYHVYPSNEKCRFSPEYREVKLSCCPEVSRIDFKCECEEEKGRVLISVSSKSCIQGTNMHVYEGEMMPGKKPVMTLQANRSGQFDSACNLKCNTNYTIVPANEYCTFKPESQVVWIPCCPEYAAVEFDCDCGLPGSVPTPSSSWYHKTLSFFKQLFSLLM